MYRINFSSYAIFVLIESMMVGILLISFLSGMEIRGEEQAERENKGCFLPFHFFASCTDILAYIPQNSWFLSYLYIYVCLFKSVVSLVDLPYVLVSFSV